MSPSAASTTSQRFWAALVVRRAFRFDATALPSRHTDDPGLRRLSRVAERMWRAQRGPSTSGIQACR
jgi:hypothetical protein